ncbi:MAG: hypothetical protein ABR520_12270 [Mycobacteriales bacterium]|nr:hypothetical protein [Frankia sp.]
MRTRRFGALLTTTLALVLLAPMRAADAMTRLLGQPEAPPPVGELGAPKPWTYWMARALMLGAGAALAGTVLLYVVKARSFRPNQRRGGTK